MRDPMDAVATALPERYELVREFGADGMVRTYLARDLLRGLEVLIKVLAPELVTESVTERFLREIAIVSRLAHPHIVPVLDTFATPGLVGCVMPHLKGETLRRRLERERQLPLNTALSIARQVGEALDYAHRQGVVHRDIKPENVLLVGDDALITDFGIAKVIAEGGSRLTATGMALGTPAYMSPEQAMADRTLDGRTDIYSLGCVLFEMLAGEPPYTGPSAMAVIARHLTDTPPSLRDFRAGSPRAVDDAVQRALAKMPADRFQTARELADAISGGDAGSTAPIEAPAPRAAAGRTRARRTFGLPDFTLPVPDLIGTWRRLSTGRKRGAAKPPPDGGAYAVWYATNRERETAGRGRVVYGPGRGAQLHYGWCRVEVPRSHRIGSLGSPWWKRLLLRRDDRLKLRQVRECREERFWAAAAAALAALPDDERHGVVFIHGYNVSFEGAALRAAQLGYDLQVKGLMAFFSWPSQGTLLGYSADEATIEASERDIASFLEDFANRSGAARVHVIAHSMGNRGLLRAVQRIVARANAGTDARFSHLILAAPDVDCDVFLELAEAYRQVAQRTTLYISDRDRALDASSFLHSYPRAGFAPPVTVVPGIDTVHVANVDLTLLGHGYVGEVREVLNDMFSLLWHDAPPGKRMGLEEKSLPDGRRYWEIRA